MGLASAYLRRGFFLSNISAVANYVQMINLTTGTITNVRVTLTERTTIPSASYLFRFVQRATNREIRVVQRGTDDVSAYPDRYNLFAFDVDQIFCGIIGEYQYYIYEQSSASNTELDLTGALIEQGLARLNAPADDQFTFTAYAPDNTYITA